VSDHGDRRRCLYGDPTTPDAHPWAPVEDEAQPFFQQAVELGVTFWDTANRA
jgi:aryl-alcohol dehydrogenase-like predicted oxidoreductase